MYLFLCLYLRPPRGGGRDPGKRCGVGGAGSIGGIQVVGSPGGRFTGVEGDQRRGRSSGVVGRVGGMGSG